MKTILITAIGGDIAQGVADIIRNCSEQYRLIGTDTHEEHGGTLYVDRFYQVPRAMDANYESSILKIIKQESVDIAMPISEPELQKWAGSDRRTDSVRWVMLRENIINTCLDKLETIRFLEQLDLPVPWTVSAKESEPSSLPCILKDRFGSGSKNVNIVGDWEDVAYLQSKYPDAIYQELLLPAENEVTCAVYRTRDGRVGVLQMRRKMSGGLSSWIEIIDDRATRTLCEKIANGFDLIGSFNVQLRITQQGPRVFEINPRFSSTALMRHALGFSDVLWSLAEIKGEHVNFPEVDAHTVAVRTHSAEVIGKPGETNEN